MPEPRRRSRSLRRIYRRTPKGRVTVLYRRRKPKPARCGICKARLHGVPRERPVKMKNMAKTKKRPQRIFGGVLCASCTREVMKYFARVKAGAMKLKEVPIRFRRYVEQIV